MGVALADAGGFFVEELQAEAGKEAEERAVEEQEEGEGEGKWWGLATRGVGGERVLRRRADSLRRRSETDLRLNVVAR